MYNVLVDTSALAPEAWLQAVRARRMPLLRRALRLAVVVAADAPSADAQAAWLSPAERWMRRSLGLDAPELALPDQQAPWAALAALSVGASPGDAAWGLAMPVHLQLGRDSLQLADPAQLQLDPAHAQSLLDAVLPLLHEQQWQARLLRPACWLLAHPSLREVRSADPLRAIGRNAASWMPGGDAAAPWRRLLTEIQMVWQDHPVNRQRHELGLPEVNSLWLHGCGVLALLPSSPFVCDPAQVQSWRDGSCAWLGALGDALAALPRSRHPHPLRVLQPAPQAALDVESACTELDRRFDLELREALQAHAAARVVLAGARSWVELELRGSRAWHFWRDRAAAPLLERI